MTSGSAVAPGLAQILLQALPLGIGEVAGIGHVHVEHCRLSCRCRAYMHDTRGARRLLAGLKYFVPRLKTIWADQAYRGHELAQWCQAHGDWKLVVVGRSPGAHGSSKPEKRWIVERTFSWLCRNRRMSKDYERKVQTSETLIVAVIRLLVARLGRSQ
jgi:transposase